jgi:hypothetical protein
LPALALLPLPALELALPPSLASPPASSGLLPAGALSTPVAQAHNGNRTNASNPTRERASELEDGILPSVTEIGQS